MTQVASGNRRLRSYGVASALVLVSAYGLAPPAHAAAAAAAAHSSPDLPASPGFNLEMTGTSTESVEGPDESFRQFTVNLDMKSGSQEPVTIVGIGRSGPGLELLSPGKQDSQVLQPRQSLGFSLKYKIIDCAAVPKGSGRFLFAWRSPASRRPSTPPSGRSVRIPGEAGRRALADRSVDGSVQRFLLATSEPSGTRGDSSPAGPREVVRAVWPMSPRGAAFIFPWGTASG